jgi:glyoxylate utilization-related uncharacterized protein
VVVEAQTPETPIQPQEMAVLAVAALLTTARRAATETRLQLRRRKATMVARVQAPMALAAAAVRLLSVLLEHLQQQAATAVLARHQASADRQLLTLAVVAAALHWFRLTHRERVALVVAEMLLPQMDQQQA